MDGHLVSALPYVDNTPYTEEVQKEVLSLIEAEMRTFTPEDYLTYLPLPPALSFDDSPLLQQEWQRVESGEKLNFDTSNYVPKPPSEYTFSLSHLCLLSVPNQREILIPGLPRSQMRELRFKIRKYR